MKNLGWSLGSALILLAALWMSGPEELAAQASLTAEDRAEIRDLYARYAQSLDLGDADGWARTFTEDGVFADNRGHAELSEFAADFYERYGGLSRHWNNQLTLRPTAEGATGTVYLLLWDMRPDTPTVVASGVYHDTLVKTSEGWRFQERRVDIDRSDPEGP